MGRLTGLVPVLFAVVVLFAACVLTEEGERVGVEQLTADCINLDQPSRITPRRA